jgi:hypothetical protein
MLLIDIYSAIDRYLIQENFNILVQIYIRPQESPNERMFNGYDPHYSTQRQWCCWTILGKSIQD